MQINPLTGINFQTFDVRQSRGRKALPKNYMPIVKRWKKSVNDITGNSQNFQLAVTI